MDEKDRYLEENIAKLVTASLTQPDPLLKAHLFTRLAGEQRRIYTGREFPNSALVLLAVVILGLTGWAVMQLTGSNLLSSQPILPVVLLLLGLNLVWVPLAGILIVKRRRIHG
jgi:hypothetical protein